ncbi:hypothetical protein [Rosenbergiella nectarea]|uniref:hypothetical protein n=1 Tax=Rosenbergiella nectarea TaxID=988801 RepID=UPI001F4E8623|nr:hypothetical protein [Rosenbergiella nectarea]
MSEIYFLILLLLSNLISFSTQAKNDDYQTIGGHINFLANATGREGSGVAEVNFTPPPSSSALVSRGNVWVAYGTDVQINDPCISWKGSVIMSVTYTRDSGGSFDRQHIIPASFIFDAPRQFIDYQAEDKLKSVNINSFSGQGIKLINSCNHTVNVSSARQIAIGENRWDLYVEGTVPAKNQCSISTQGSIDMGTLSINQLINSRGRPFHEMAKSLPVNWFCSDNQAKSKITLIANDVYHSCIQSKNKAMRYCIYSADSSTPFDLTSGSQSFTVEPSQRDLNLIIVPASGSSPITGLSQGQLILKIEPE